ncbi:MAG: Clp protease ClpP [Muribaculaceae bacterium]|nr:Clp protease ClpP [Muribaculaceae bacterium]
MAKKKYNLHLKGYVGGGDFDADYVDYILGKNDGQEVNVLIDSLGGSVATALSISSAFRNHGNVNVHYVGMNASAATIASLGARHVSIDASAMYLVHKCSSLVFKFAQLNADELQSLIEECEQQKNDLQKIDLNIASMYAGKCKKNKEDLLELMRVGGWLSAKEALDWGFVDEITDNPEDSAPAIDDATISALASAGIPIPNVTKEKDGFFAKLISSLSALFANNHSSSKIITAMNKTFRFVCALLQVDALTSNDGKITLSDEQMQAVEDRIAALESQVTDLNNQISDKDSLIENLKKTPADDSTTVVDEGKKDRNFANEYVDSLNNARNMFNSIP